MSARVSSPHHDAASVAALRARGYDVTDIQSLARDHQAFAVRAAARRTRIASGVRLDAAAVDLDGGAFTNVHTLRVDLEHARTEPVSRSRTDSVRLRDLVAADDTVAAASGSFSFISDDATYQPAEPALDLCCRDGEVVSLPTATKPAFLIHHARPVITTLNASGSLTLGGRTYRWRGSKEPRSSARNILTVFGAANCRIRYTDDPLTGFRRDVDPSTNITPNDPAATDAVVSRTPHDGYRVTALHPGGGADLFAGNFVLRCGPTQARHLRVGARVQITRIGSLDPRDIVSGFSLGPSVANAAAGTTSAYDACLGDSPFRHRRCARTLITLRGMELLFQVLDGAPLATNFRGVTPAESAALCAADGLDPGDVYHLDGGASSKIAFSSGGTTDVVGSMHYLRWPDSPSEPFRWTGLDGRALHSAFVIKTRHFGGTQ